MFKAKHGWFLVWWALMACGPETIFVRPSLDTPEQHVRNGEILLGQAKWKDACREFQRAAELNPTFTQAYIGLGIAYARDGDLDTGWRMMRKAERLAANEAEYDAVKKGMAQLNQIRQERNAPVPSQGPRNH